MRSSTQPPQVKSPTTSLESHAPQARGADPDKCIYYTHGFYALYHLQHE